MHNKKERLYIIEYRPKQIDWLNDEWRYVRRVRTEEQAKTFIDQRKQIAPQLDFRWRKAGV